MKKEEIQLTDIQRILFGQAPAEFILEVLLRTTIVYVALIILLRFLGKRMDGQITIIEMAVMITLGAIVSVGMQIPDRGILLSIAALICILIFQKGINWLAIKNDQIRELTEGTMSIIVKDGVLQLDEMQTAGITKQNLFAFLRSQKIYNLGKVKRVYFEAYGMFNVYEDKNEQSGLPVLPADELEFVKTNTRSDNARIACKNCGFTDEANQKDNACKNCGKQQWIEAIY